MLVVVQVVVLVIKEVDEEVVLILEVKDGVVIKSSVTDIFEKNVVVS